MATPLELHETDDSQPDDLPETDDPLRPVPHGGPPSGHDVEAADS